jgi:hypothetical protein
MILSICHRQHEADTRTQRPCVFGTRLGVEDSSYLSPAAPELRFQYHFNDADPDIDNDLQACPDAASEVSEGQVAPTTPCTGERFNFTIDPLFNFEDTDDSLGFDPEHLQRNSVVGRWMAEHPAFTVVKTAEQWELEREIRAVSMVIDGAREGQRRAKRRQPVKDPMEARIDACIDASGYVNYRHVVEFLQDLQGPLRLRCNVNVFTQGIICFASTLFYDNFMCCSHS